MVKIIKRGVIPDKQPKQFGGAQGKNNKAKGGRITKAIKDSKLKSQYNVRGM